MKKHITPLQARLFPEASAHPPGGMSFDSVPKNQQKQDWSQLPRLQDPDKFRKAFTPPK